MSPRLRWVPFALLLGLAAASAGAQEGVAYLRTVEGYAEHGQRQGGSLDFVQAVANTPLVPGDRLSVPAGTRLEAVLADGSMVRLGDHTELVVTALARSLESADSLSALDVERGELQVSRTSYSGPEMLEIRLPAATAYLEAPGVYRLSSDGYGSTWVTVREGFAEVATSRGSALVRAGETAWLDGFDAPRLELTQALAQDELERWGEQLDGAARLADVPYVEEELAYAAAPLAQYGGWVEASGRHGWQPYVQTDWRPYTSGSWAYGPGGLNWISTEPWGWVTSHYGSWDFLPGFGWVWFPGEVYAPAWVYWYWGPTHVGWVPAGYYLSVYASHGYLPVPGVYGWVGGTWADYSLWTFCDLDGFGQRGHHRRFSSGHELARVTRSSAIPRGLLATDTRSLTPDVWRDPSALKTRLLANRGKTVEIGLPDVTRFAVRRDAAHDAGRWFESKGDALRRNAATRLASASKENGRLDPGRSRFVTPRATAATSARPSLVRPADTATAPVKQPVAAPPSRPAVRPSLTTPQRPPVITIPATPSRAPVRPWVATPLRPTTARPPVTASLPSRPPVRPWVAMPSRPTTTPPPVTASPSRPPVRPWVATPWRPPTTSRPGTVEPRVWTRPDPRSGVSSSPTRSYGVPGRPETSLPGRALVEAHEGRSVAQRVVEDIRSGGAPSWRHPAPPSSGFSARSASLPDRVHRRPPESSKPPSRGNASSRKPPRF